MGEAMSGSGVITGSAVVAGNFAVVRVMMRVEWVFHEWLVTLSWIKKLIVINCIF